VPIAVEVGKQHCPDHRTEAGGSRGGPITVAEE
jgi:hypothetical protein